MNKLNLKKQMPKNLAMNVVSFVTNVLIGLWLIPYLVKYIGIAAYGLVPLAMIFSEYIGLIVQSLNSSINRFLLIALQKKDFVQANQVFNTSLSMMFLLLVVQSLIMIFIVFNLSEVVNIPTGLIDDAFWLFVLTFLGFSLSLLRAVVSTPIFAYNRLDILRLIDIVQVLARVFVIVLFFTMNEPELKYVGVANLVGSIVAFSIALFYNRKFAPQLKIDPRMIDMNRMKDLASMSGWVLVNQIGFLLFLKVDLYIANKFIGTIQAGEYAAMMQWSTLLRAMAGVFSGIVTPVVMIYYARGEIDKLISMLKIGVKLMGIIMAIPIAILSALSGEILGAWLGAEYTYLGTLMLLSLVPLVINLSVLPLFSVNTSYNKVKIPGIVSLLLGLINVVLALVLVKYFNLELYGLVIASAFVLTVKNAIFTPLYAAYILDIKRNTFMVYQLAGIMFFIFIFLATKIFSYVIYTGSVSSLLLTLGLSSIVGGIILLGYLYRDREMLPLVNPILTKLKLKRYVINE